MNKELLEKLGITAPIKEIVSYKTSKGALYENKELAEKAEINIQIGNLVDKFLETRKPIYCHECDNRILIEDEIVAFVRYLMGENNNG
jgi:hypothetical protein